jgi:hypothetical protein
VISLFLSVPQANLKKIVLMHSSECNVSTRFIDEIQGRFYKVVHTSNTANRAGKCELGRGGMKDAILFSTV